MRILKVLREIAEYLGMYDSLGKQKALKQRAIATIEYDYYEAAARGMII